MIEASRSLARLAPQLLRAAGLRGNWPDAKGEIVPKDLSSAEEVLFVDHVETLLFGWGHGCFTVAPPGAWP